MLKKSEDRHCEGGGNERESNFELFRIILMLMIIAHHYYVNSGMIAIEGNDLQILFLKCFGYWGKIGINCFVLISGYFMCGRKISLKKFIKLYAELLFYGIAIYLFFVAIGDEAFTLRGIAGRIPVFSNIKVGFTSSYMLYYLFIPFLNVLVEGMSKKMHGILVGLCIFVFSVWSNLSFVVAANGYLIWFMVLFLVASYIRKYPDKILDNKLLWRLMAVVAVLFAVIRILIYSQQGKSFEYILGDSEHYVSFIVSICLFMCFKGIEIPYNRWINRIASTTFGIYIIHTNSDTMRSWLWGDVFKNVSYYGTKFLVVHAVCTVVVVFVVCMIIDLIRQYVFERPFMRMVEKVLN